MTEISDKIYTTIKYGDIHEAEVSNYNIQYESFTVLAFIFNPLLNIRYETY